MLCPTILVKLTNWSIKYTNIVPKTLCKNSPKNPQKPRKNLVRKNPAKIFYDFFNKKPAKNFATYPKTS
jgi:hypothetical protein